MPQLAWSPVDGGGLGSGLSVFQISQQVSVKSMTKITHLLDSKDSTLFPFPSASHIALVTVLTTCYQQSVP